MTPPDLRPGYAQIEAASQLAPASEAWWPFMRDFLGLPLSMLPAVQWVVKANVWKRARYPIQSVKTSAERRAARESKAVAKGQ